MLAYVLYLTVSSHALAVQPIRGAACAAVLALGTAFLTGTETTLGQLAGASGAGVAVLLLVSLVFRNTHTGTAVVFAAALTASSVGVGAVLVNNVDVRTLLPLLLVPLTARAPVSHQLPHWLRGIVVSACAAAPAAGGVLIDRTVGW